MRAYLKEPIGAFIIRTRVETAAKLLRYTDLPVADIAYRVGYDTPSSLTKSFCKFFGISPKMYRLTKNYQMMTTQEPKAEVKLSRAKVVEQEPKTLSICRTIIEILSGDISVVSAPGKGTCFKIVHPVHRTETAAETAGAYR